METFNYLEEIIMICIENKVTDIHIDLDKDHLVLRQNKRFLMRYPFSNMLGLFNHLKYKSGLKMDSILKPQTGSFQYFSYDKVLYLRFAALETMNRKHGVLRILNLIVLSSLKSCGIDDGKISKILSMLATSNGLVLFAGKTGVGKSTTMYASLSHLQDRQIFSLESPIERVIPSIIQIEYDSKELDTHITQLLRHDPDLLIVGEVRTSDELMHVVRASLSGHLVLTTLHAGSIEEVFLRLQDLNYSEFDITDVIQGVVYQYVEYSKEGVVFRFEVYDQKDIKHLARVSTT